MSGTIESHRLRRERLDALLREVSPGAVGLSPDSVRALQNRRWGMRTFEPTFGVLDMMIQSGALLLVDNTEPRSRLSGLPAFWKRYTDNVDYVFDAYLPSQIPSSRPGRASFGGSIGSR